jgi:hypothetical protein
MASGPQAGRVWSREDDVGKALAKGLALAAVVPALVIGLGSSPTRAHSDWGLPLVGGLVGGYGLSYMMNRSKEEKPPAPTYAAPTYATPAYATPAAPPPSAASTAASIEHQLNVLDDLAAKGYITQDEYKTRRQALLNQL